MAEYRTIVGVVQFDPREGKAGGKDVRNLRVRQTGVHEKEALSVSATLWPEFSDIEVVKGDAVIVEGKYGETQGTNKDGEAVIYYNLSVNRILVLGQTDSGREPDVENATDSSGQSDEELPF